MIAGKSKNYFSAALIPCLLCSIILPCAVKGNEMDLTQLSIEELMNIPVHGASRFEQPLSEAPASITIITADEIQKYGYRTMADIIKSVRSFFVTYDRNYAYLGVRGFGIVGNYNGRVLVLVDGHRMNEIIFDQAMIETGFTLDIDLIDSIELNHFRVYSPPLAA